MVALIVLAVVDVIAIGVLLSPLAKSRQQSEAELRQVHQQFKDKEREVGPSRGMDKKIASATGDIASFYDHRLPGQYSGIDAALVKAAQVNGVQLQDVRFRPDKREVEDLQRVDVELTISGPYVSDVKFINTLERDKIFFVIDSVSLGSTLNGIQLQVRAETYFRTGAA
jgi:type IV pilus assembly protein PilO